jgi:hypothetical protein
MTCICIFLERDVQRSALAEEQPAPTHDAAVKGGAMDCPYTFMQDMVSGTFRLPWEDQVKKTGGTSWGFPVPTRVFGAKAAKAAE